MRNVWRPARSARYEIVSPLKFQGATWNLLRIFTNDAEKMESIACDSGYFEYISSRFHQWTPYSVCRGASLARDVTVKLRRPAIIELCREGIHIDGEAPLKGIGGREQSRPLPHPLTSRFPLVFPRCPGSHMGTQSHSLMARVAVDGRSDNERVGLIADQPRFLWRRQPAL